MTHLFCYGLLILPIIGFFVFWVSIHINSLLMPFQDPKTGAFTWQNFDIIIKSIKGDDYIAIAFKNTILYFLSGLFTAYGLSLFCSYVLFKKLAGYRFFTIIFMIPQMISSVIMIAAFKFLISADNGPLMKILDTMFHYELPPLLYRDSTATGTIIFFQIFTGFGSNLILFSGAMAKIPPEVIESAEIEGIGFFREFFTMEVPLIAHTILILLLFGVMGFLGASGPILLFSGGKYSTQTISFWFYQNVVETDNYNVASAFGMLLSLVSLPLVIVCQWLKSQLEVVEY